jgi:hypothetical protein
VAQPTPSQTPEPTEKNVPQPTTHFSPSQSNVEIALPPKVPGTEAVYDHIRANVQRQVAKKGNGYAFSVAIDEASTGRIILTSDAPASVIADILAPPAGSSIAEKQVGNQVIVQRGKMERRQGRRDDTPPYYGGAGIVGQGGYCTAGYAVRNSSGRSYMVSAGHCNPIGQAEYTEISRRYFGTTGSGRQLRNGKDIQLIEDQSYVGRIFVGGVNSVVSLPVYGAGPWTIGFNNYCLSGRTTGETCGRTLQADAHLQRIDTDLPSEPGSSRWPGSQADGSRLGLMATTATISLARNHR